MISIELLNAIIAASTSIIVVILSQKLIDRKESRRMREDERSYLLKEYINPIRFILVENYYRIKKIVDETKNNENKNKKILNALDETGKLNRTTEWFVGEGCYLMTSCYLLSCLFAYMENIRKDMPFLKLDNHIDTEIMQIINKLTAGFSKDLNIYYAIQMYIGKEVYIKQEQRVITYREFCELLQKEENVIWFESLIKYFIRISSGQYNETEYIIADIMELTKYLDNIVSGGDSIKQKVQAEQEVAERG